MDILVTNDDGYQALGINTLAEALRPHAQVTVVAPDSDRSGASNSLTLRTPLRVQKLDSGVQVVNGTPTDCVHLAITGLLDHAPDMVFSGINSGPNLGDDVLYSGTVAAAMEGRFLGYPAVAISLAGASPTQYASAARAAVELLHLLNERPLPTDTILNVNVPDLPWGQIAGYRATRLGNRHVSEPSVRMVDPLGQPFYFIGPPGDEHDAGPDTDFHAVGAGWIAVTPLSVDLTQHTSLKLIDGWLPK